MAETVLAYDSGRAERQVPLWWRIALAVIYGFGAVLPFVPYVHGVSPAEAASEVVKMLLRGRVDEWMWLLGLGIGFHFAFLIMAWKLLLCFRPKLNRRIAELVWAAGVIEWAVVGILVAGWSVILLQDWRGDTESMFMLAAVISGSTFLLMGLGIVVRLGWQKNWTALASVIVTAPYAANLLICTLFFLAGGGGNGRDALGYWLTIPVLAGCMAEIVYLGIGALRSGRVSGG